MAYCNHCGTELAEGTNFVPRAELRQERPQPEKTDNNSPNSSHDKQDNRSIPRINLPPP